MKQIQEKFDFKGDTWNDLSIYLGARISKKIDEGTKMWTMSSSDYLKAAITEIEKVLQEKGQQLPKKATTAMHKSYKPELDSTPELDQANITYFQELIGILRWAIEIGRVDVLTEVSRTMIKYILKEGWSSRFNDELGGTPNAPTPPHG